MNTKPYTNYRHSTMSLTGQGQISATPNLAIVRLGVQTNGMNLLEVQAENAEISRNVLQALRQMGVSDIKTYQYLIDKNYTYENGNRIDNGYTVRNIMEIRTSDIDKVGEIIDTAVNNGANIVDLISFDVSNKEFYYQQALNQAIGNAIHKSKSIAMYMGLPMDPIPFRIIENSSIQPYPVNTFREGAFTTPIEPGKYLIDASVTIYFYY